MEYELFTPSPQSVKPAHYDGGADPIFSQVFEACQEKVRGFSYEAARKKYESLSRAVEQTIKPTILAIEPLQAYLEHIANNGRLFEIINDSRDFQLALPAGIKELSFSSSFLNESHGERTERLDGQYALTEREYLDARTHIHNNPALSRILQVVQDITGGYFSQMNHYFHENQRNMARFPIEQMTLTEKITAASQATFIEELLPALTKAGLSDALHNAQDPSSIEKAFQQGLIESFRLNAFRVQEENGPRKCPFSSGAVQLWSSVISKDGNGDYKISPHLRPGALPAFIAEEIRKLSAPASSPKNLREFTL